MKTALVTGAAKRIGRSIAERLLQENYRLVLHAHSSSTELKRWVDQHNKALHVVEIIEADLSDERGQQKLIDKSKSCISSLDLVVHNASAFGPCDFLEIDRARFQMMLEVNLYAPFFLTQGLIPELLASTSPCIVNIIDAMWERPSAQYSHYAVSKAGLAILTRALATELAPKIRVNAVAPGAILFQPFHTEEQRSKTLERILQKRLGSPADIAEAVLFLSDKAKYATGEIFVIDGGRCIVP